MGLRGLHVGVKLILFQLYLAIALSRQLGASASWQHGGGWFEHLQKNNIKTADKLIPVGLTGQGNGIRQPGIILSALTNRERAQQVRWPRALAGSENVGQLKAESENSIANEIVGSKSKKPAAPSEQPEEEEPIPSEYILLVKLGVNAGDLNHDMKEELKTALADILGIPVENVLLDKIRSQSNTVELSFLRAGHNPKNFSLDDLLTAKQAQNTIASSGLLTMLPNLKVQDVYTEDDVTKTDLLWSFWTQPYFPYVAAAAALVLLILVLLLIWCCIRRRRNKLDVTSGRSSPSPPPHIPRQQICLYPSVAKPDLLHNVTLIQPEVTQIITNKSCGECGTPVHTPPMKIKSRKVQSILERRGSNASLTLDLGPTGPESKPTWGSPPRESSAEEYLLSAGHRMSRKELRNCLKNLKSIHAEFWEIPMNHPDKVEVAGSGVKNRYRTIIPNESTRVILPEIDNDILTTYINANHIRGFAVEPNAYIATQGPMNHTVNDFWRMVWQERAPLIVMITKLKKKKVPTATLR